MESPAGKRKALTLEQRVAALKKLDSGQSCRDVAKEMGCGKTQIARIKSKKEDVMKECESGARSDQKTVKRRKTQYEDLNNVVLEWFYLSFYLVFCVEK
ncbi:hypothetical protein V1264_004283 [Littorina saxatilis]|uniref:HTH psq-type domain-containing protein n=1 Tax=Littorina saxatilis TaxID=31220 RepID=A0AAN9G6G9_9CAEN